jgi:hypothetical protein
MVSPEHKFHPKRRWRIDYYLPTLRIGIEIEGGVWSGVTRLNSRTCPGSKQ